MPSFLGIGAQKAGTTWLFEQLRRHPDVAFPAGKEIHFWDQLSVRSIAWYESLFKPFEGSGKQTGDITPAYAILPPKIIEICHNHFPDLRLVYILRNPIDRAWSHAKMHLEKKGVCIARTPESWFIEHFRSSESLQRGDHETCIRNWLSFYPREQLLICRFEDLASNPRLFLKSCLHHLGVDETNYDWKADFETRVFPTHTHPLPPGLRAELKAIYGGKLQSLQKFLGFDLSEWEQ